LEAPRKGWLAAFDVVQIGFAPPYAVDVSLGRLKGDWFQVQLLEGGYGRGLGSDRTLCMAVLGVGARWMLDAERRHEIGFLAFPLSFEIFDHDYPDPPPRTCPPGDLCFDFNFTLDLAAGYGRTRLYYRYNLEKVGFEVAVAAPLVTYCDRLWGCAPPVFLTIGISSGRNDVVSR
jgi:hypothetical protein